MFPGIEQKYAHYLWTTERLKSRWSYFCRLIRQLNTVGPTHQLQHLCSEMLLMLVPWPYRCLSSQILADTHKIKCLKIGMSKLVFVEGEWWLHGRPIYYLSIFVGIWVSFKNVKRKKKSEVHICLFISTKISTTIILVFYGRHATSHISLISLSSHIRKQMHIP
jgi:hypothetical protein